ncbi:MAG: preprotein translocase subunit SecG [Methylophilaceae bacterium]|jgi:preprotein translocase subunit SecG|nr:preprotein translocase subunit SecG [Methyloradius sp.]
METIVMIVHVCAALSVIGLVLLQHGKGADMGAAFGSGASGSLFGVSGSSNFMSRATSVSVAVFFATSLTLAYLSSHRPEHTSVIKLQDTTSVAPAKAGDADVPSKSSETSVKDTPAKDVPN